MRKGRGRKEREGEGRRREKVEEERERDGNVFCRINLNKQMTNSGHYTFSRSPSLKRRPQTARELLNPSQFEGIPAFSCNPLSRLVMEDAIKDA